MESHREHAVLEEEEEEGASLSPSPSAPAPGKKKRGQHREGHRDPGYLCKAWAGQGTKAAPQVTAKSSRHRCSLPLGPAGIASSPVPSLPAAPSRPIPEGRMLL